MLVLGGSPDGSWHPGRMTDDLPAPDLARSTDDGSNEWWPALPGSFSGPSDDDVLTLP
jgi:hypothetical protein